jgi:hypothetical protein
VADAAHAILTRDSRMTTGRFFLDQAVLEEEGMGDFDSYAVSPGSPLVKDLLVDWSQLSDMTGRTAVIPKAAPLGPALSRRPAGCQPLLFNDSRLTCDPRGARENFAELRRRR